MYGYLYNILDVKRYCENFKKHVFDAAFKDSKTGKILSKPNSLYYCWTPLYQSFWTTLNGIIEICDILGIEELEVRKEDLVTNIGCLNSPESVSSREAFEYYVNFIKDIFKKVQKEINNKLHILDAEEAYRLNEALNCYLEKCNYSAVAMSVSVIEYRLHSLMKSKCPDADLEKLTLGRLIGEYLENETKYGDIIPEEHEHLLQYCNKYRIFSVHSKKEKITKPIATAIINMTFSFLLDEDMKVKIGK